MRNYNDAMLAEHVERRDHLRRRGSRATCNAAGSRILRRDEEELVGKPPEEVFSGTEWLVERIRHVAETRSTDLVMDAEVAVDGETVSANVTVLPLLSHDDEHLGTLVMIEDILEREASEARRSPATWTRISRTACSRPAPEERARRQRVRRDRPLLGHPQLHDALRAARAAADRRVAQRVLRADGRLHLRATAGCSTSSSATRSWRSSACRSPATTTRIARCARRSRCCAACVNGTVERERRGEPTLDIGVGLNTDAVVAGNIGSPKRHGLHDHRRRREPRVAARERLQALRH